jgi:hypothetical protein
MYDNARVVYRTFFYMGGSMKKFIDGFQLILFFGIACMMYLYASNMIGASTQGAKNIEKNIIELKPADAYKIWKAIKRLGSVEFLKR